MRRPLKLQPNEGDNLDERIVTIPCKRVYGATQTRPCEKSGCSRLRCTVKVFNKMRLFRSREQLRRPAKTAFPTIGRRCRRRRFRWDFPPVANGQENVRLSPESSLIRNSSTIQPANSPSCGWSLKAHSHEHEITNETSNDKSAQRQTRRRFIHTATSACPKRWWKLAMSLAHH